MPTIGRYLVSAELGRGGMGVVYRARDPQLGREVAIKVLLASAAGPQEIARFEREARAAARLDHPGVVAVHEVGVDHGGPFIVMDFVPGETLAASIRRERLPPREVARIVRDVALAVQHAHEAGVIHRDIKPANVLLGADGRPRLGDFGLARDAGSHQLTVTGQVLGTPSYMAPEQAGDEASTHGPAIDVYGLGGLLYAGLTGRPPVEAETAAALIKKVLLDDPDPPRRLAPTVHLDLETITLRCLEKIPERRYPRAADVAAELGRFIDGEAIQARPLGRLGRARRWAGRNRLTTAAVTVLGVALLGSVAVGAELLRRERRRPIEEARANAEAAWIRFDDVKEGRADEALAAGLDALEAGSRVVALDPAPALAARAAEAAFWLGDIAERDEQWSVAEVAFEKAGTFARDPTRRGDAERRAAGVLAARDRRVAEEEGIVRELLRQGGAGELTRKRGGWEDALFELVRLDGPATARLLAAELGRVTAELKRSLRELYGALAEPTEEEAAVGLARIEGIDVALEASLGGRLDAAAAATLGRAERRLQARTWRATDDVLGHRDVTSLVVSTQEEAVGVSRLRGARLCCDALGRIGRSLSDDAARREVIDALGAYLRAERNERRAVQAALALCTIGGDVGRPLVAAHHQFGRNGALWKQVRRYLAREDSRVSIVEAEGADALVDRALLRRAKVDGVGARADLDRAIALEPRNVRAITERGQLRRADDPAGALADFERALEIDPRWVRALTGRSRQRRIAGDTAGAEADLDAAIEIDPDDPTPWHMRGRLKVITGRLVEAREDYHHAARLAPRFSPSWVALGVTYQRLGDGASALAALNRAVRVEPNDPVALSNRGMVLREFFGDHESARDDLARAVELEPEQSRFWINHGLVLIDLSELHAAIESFDHAIELDAGIAQAWEGRAVARANAGDVVGATADLDRALELDPALPGAWVARGTIARVRGDLDRALEDLRRGIELRPDDHGAWAHLGILHRRRGELEAALRAFSNARRLVPRSPFYHQQIALVLVELGRTAEALDALDEAVSIDPRNGVPLARRADLRRAHGDLAGALVDAEAAALRSPRSPEAWHALGLARSASGDLEGASVAFGRAVEAHPRRPQSLLRRGTVRARLGQATAARADLERVLELAPDSPWAEEARSALARLPR